MIILGRGSCRFVIGSIGECRFYKIQTTKSQAQPDCGKKGRLIRRKNHETLVSMVSTLCMFINII